MPRLKVYKTPQEFPKCVRYWEQFFQTESYCFDWQLMRSIVIIKVQEVKSTLCTSEKNARMLVWNAYCAAVQGKKKSPFFLGFQDLVEAIPEKEKPLFLVHKSIGCDIHRGKSEQEAKQTVIEWLKADPQHGIFGQYRLTPEFEVLRR